MILLTSPLTILSLSHFGPATLVLLLLFIYSYSFHLEASAFSISYTRNIQCPHAYSPSLPVGLISNVISECHYLSWPTSQHSLPPSPTLFFVVIIHHLTYCIFIIYLPKVKCKLHEGKDFVYFIHHYLSL